MTTQIKFIIFMLLLSSINAQFQLDFHAESAYIRAIAFDVESYVSDYINSYDDQIDSDNNDQVDFDHQSYLRGYNEVRSSEYDSVTKPSTDNSWNSYIHRSALNIPGVETLIEASFIWDKLVTEKESAFASRYAKQYSTSFDDAKNLPR